MHTGRAKGRRGLHTGAVADEAAGHRRGKQPVRRVLGTKGVLGTKEMVQPCLIYLHLFGWAPL